MLQQTYFLVVLMGVVALSLISSTAQAAMAPSVKDSVFGTMNGATVNLHTLTNSKGMSVSISDLGATIVKIIVPDKSGKFDDVTLGYDTLKPYETNSPYFGVNPGRYANRIAKGKFTLDGKSYTLALNNSPNTLHGGKRGFDKYIYAYKKISDNPPTVVFTRVSKDGEEGYPGNLTVSITFTLKSNNALHIAYDATTDKPTIVNLTNHSYFNLQGQTADTILNHVVQINASKMTPVDSTLIPTGKLLAVKGTPYDFTSPTPIGTHLHELSGTPVGYDYNYVLDKGAKYGPVALVYEPVSGRTLTVKSNQPGVQFYTGNFLDGTLSGKGKIHYPQYSGFCLECQDFPDAPNQPSFPSAVLRPGGMYHNDIEFIFGTR